MSDAINKAVCWPQRRTTFACSKPICHQKGSRIRATVSAELPRWTATTHVCKLVDLAPVKPGERDRVLAVGRGVCLGGRGTGVRRRPEAGRLVEALSAREEKPERSDTR